ncbi:hypothetical protein M0654_14115 [Rhizobium sp. NTR19]|uniref:Uncharacterized protein n=1 Tax=Neorhizobium turbinariae TaxID=2937795 RepID=A0ABT0ITB7_9HYPH|nr:hypothetical protein [Neorhizobium turbinariae]MCK8781118.1 hypothetical protein [Neorhizobium turbinariae]
MTAVLIRIGLRYRAGALIAKGLIAPDVGLQIADDVDLQQAIEVGIGVAAGAASEICYILARKLGWAK